MLFSRKPWYYNWCWKSNIDLTKKVTTYTILWCLRTCDRAYRKKNKKIRGNKRKIRRKNKQNSRNRRKINNKNRINTQND